LLVVDDNEIVRMGVRTLLSQNKEWEICGEAADGVEAVQKVMDLAPDVVILDMSMPRMNGLESAQRIRQIAPSTKIVMFSVHDTPTSARFVGADAFVVKSSAAQDLVEVISQVLKS
jgi:DNA-binding NarL/FixJ family response regulator